MGQGMVEITVERSAAHVGLHAMFSIGSFFGATLVTAF